MGKKEILNKDMLKKVMQSEAFIVQAECAISLVNTKLQIINAELTMEYGRTVINSKTGRIKSYQSTKSKLARKRLEENFTIALLNINDLVGVRAVCSYTDDIYKIAQMFSLHKDVKVIKVKDYISNPKKSGYRSLHLIVEVPICFQGGTQWTKVEIQLRTAAMDYWAGLDYQLRYKKGKKEADMIGEELEQFASDIENMDIKVLDLRKKIESI